MDVPPRDTDCVVLAHWELFLGDASTARVFIFWVVLSSLNRVTKELAALLASMVALFKDLKW